jgi:hypothetical protein
MSRLNRAGVPRDELASILRSPERLRRALEGGRCLLCCASPVNEVCLCTGCFALLTDRERSLAEPYVSGQVR